MQELLGAGDVARAWGVTPERVRQLVKSGALQADFRHGRQVFWSVMPAGTFRVTVKWTARLADAAGES